MGLLMPMVRLNWTSIRVLCFRVAAIRKSLSVERLEQVFDEFHDKGVALYLGARR